MSDWRAASPPGCPLIALHSLLVFSLVDSHTLSSPFPLLFAFRFPWGNPFIHAPIKRFSASRVRRRMGRRLGNFSDAHVLIRNWNRRPCWYRFRCCVRDSSSYRWPLRKHSHHMEAGGRKRVRGSERERSGMANGTCVASGDEHSEFRWSEWDGRHLSWSRVVSVWRDWHETIAIDVVCARFAADEQRSDCFVLSKRLI